MALTAPKVAGVEHFDAPETVEKAAAQLASLIQSSKHFIVFTGAGVSTSAGIPDFRGPAGAWTLRAQGKELDFDSTQTLRTIPSPCHMALVELQSRGILKLLVSQNCDGLHRRSGILPGGIAELHGNSNLERCQKCDKEYLRDFRAVSSYTKSLNDHRTGRKCAVCGSPLLDTIVNFGEDLPQSAFDLAEAHAKKADLCLVLGSSLRVTPADSIPRIVGTRKGSTLAICNLQRTPQDDLAKIRVHAKVDDLMCKIMKELSIPIPPFLVGRNLVIKVESPGADRRLVTVSGVDSDGTPASFLRSVTLQGSRRPAKEEPFTLPMRSRLEPGSSIQLELQFMGHYGERNLILSHSVHADSTETRYSLSYDPSTGQWKYCPCEAP